MNDHQSTVGCDRAWTVALVLLAFALRLYRFGDQSLWFDEAFTWWVGAVVPWADLWPALIPFGAYTPLFYLMMRGVALVGQQEYVLRFPAAFFGVLLIPLVERIGRRVGGAAVGRLAALLVAIDPFSVWYSQDARMYTMASFFVFVAMDGFMRAIEGRGWRRAIAGAGAAYLTHYVTLFLVYIQLMWWLPSLRRQRPRFRQWLGSHLLAALMISVALIISIWFVVVSRSWAVVFGFDSKDSFLRNHVGSYTVMQFIQSQLSDQSRVLLMWDGEGYYCDARCLPDAEQSHWTQVVAGTQDISTVTTRLRAIGVTHLMYSMQDAEFIKGHDPAGQQRQAMDFFWQQYQPACARQLYRDEYRVLFKITCS